MRLQQLGAEHLAAVLEFETVNRAHFAATIADRGDEFFADYPARHQALLRMQVAGTDLFHVLMTDEGAVAGRVNLVDISDGEAELGYRVGRDFAGRGLATRSVGQVCELAETVYGLSRLRAETALTNHASRKVLLHNGFGLVAATGTSLLFRLELRRRTRP
ncbi:GNAT family N-acetyltransferase [Catellatospora tritici]|uniref:GNAT family N-acetyltransferase n=1 Tax=Catellatospora tritici TaxID=2851566 RepID=UPI001C2DDF84|nr:GNAT family N-acetyltransferase [Catellatospora tritici]MBV1850704.1 GNAT family N-acetyltransferase [Catellatospora tritici]MBV1850957.1 GNAT family N-acetyltransferase [Catellatospora tritici]